MIASFTIPEPLAHITIKHAHFLASASALASCPPPTTSEIAILGRSNVGKSTFINTLLSSPLAKSSATPGKTRLINFFASTWHSDNLCMPLHIIDMPGIGYAKVSKQDLAAWRRNLWEFLQHRSSIALFIHLIDARHRELAIDMHLASTLAHICKPNQRALSIYTKADKLHKNELARLRARALLTTNNATIARTLYAKYPHAPHCIDVLRAVIFASILGAQSCDKSLLFTASSTSRTDIKSSQAIY